MTYYRHGRTINFNKTMRKVLTRGISLVLITLIIISPLRTDFFYFSLRVFAQETSLQELTDLHLSHEVVTWNSDTDLSMYKNIYVGNNAYVFIDAGSDIALRNLKISSNAMIVAEGTAHEPITITHIAPDYGVSDEYDAECTAQTTGTISFENSVAYGNESYFSYVTFRDMGTYIDMENGGYHCPAMVKNDVHDPSIFATAYAATPATSYDPYQTYPFKASPAIYFASGKVTMRNCTFDNSEFADVVVNTRLAENDESFLHIDNSNFGTNQKGIAVRSRVKKYHVYEEYFKNQYAQCVSAMPPMMEWYEKHKVCFANALLATDSNESLFDDERVILKNNWYGHESGPDFDELSILSGHGDEVIGNVTLKLKDWRPTPDMASNVLFLPGIKASRLDFDTGDQVWLPEREEDTYYLGMSKDGESSNEIHAKNIVENAYGFVPIYDSFVEDLDELKNNNIIKDFSLFAYDWRYDVADIVKNGTKREGGVIKNPIDEIDRLAKTSASGKVTIVAHSNGGLLAKAIMIEIEKQCYEYGCDDEDIPVDNIIMVGSPQMGTPKTIVSLLHGHDEEMKKLSVTMMRAEQSRSISNNMPGAYGLLPSKEYFARTKEPLITFGATFGAYKKYKEAYGKEIEDFGEFRDFALAQKDQRDKPAFDDLMSASILNEKIFDQETALHDDIDAWIPPTGVNVIQIGGWGLDTIRGVTYTMKAKEECDIDLPFFKNGCYPTGEFESFYEPERTVDGDGTVTTPSALMLPVASNMEQYWIDLYEYNTWYKARKTHKDIVEIDEIRDFISQMIQSHHSPIVMPRYIHDNRPNNYENSRPRIRMSLYSPLDIHLYDVHDNHTGPVTTIIDGEVRTMIEENIPNSYYEVVGENKYVGWGTGDDVRVELDGYAVGSYTVKLQEVYVTSDGERNGDTVEFASLPTGADTQVYFSVPNSELKEMSDLRADYDGDGQIDYSIKPQINGIVLSDMNTDDDTSIVMQDIENDDSEEKRKASIDAWNAYQYDTQTKKCAVKMKLKIKGKHFDKNAIVKIGGTEASSIERKSHREITARFCMEDLTDVKTDALRTVSVTNPNTKRDKAHKKIDIRFISWKDVTVKNIQSANVYTVEGIRVIQKVLNGLGYLNTDNISGVYDDLTRNVIKQFQVDYQLPQTGYCGEMTKAKFNEIIR